MPFRTAVVDGLAAPLPLTGTLVTASDRMRIHGQPHHPLGSAASARVGVFVR